MDWQDLINQTLLINKTHGRLIYVPGFQNQAGGAVFAVMLLLLFEDSEGFAGAIWAIPVLQVEDMAKFITGKAMPIPNYLCLAPRSKLSICVLKVFLDKST